MYSNASPSPLRTDASYDVIVVGGRTAGAATALLLARQSLRTLLVDTRPVDSDSLSTHALMRAGVLQLSRWGVLDEIIAAGTPPLRRTTFRHGDEQVLMTVKPSQGVDALYAPRRAILDAVLVNAAAHAGVDVRHDLAVGDLLRRDDRVVGLRASGPDGCIDLRAPLVIGADGIGSTIARSVQATVCRTGQHTEAVSYAYWPDLATDGYEWNFHPNACSGVIPTNDGQVCVFASGPRDRIGRGGVDVIAEVIAESAPELAERLGRAGPPRGSRTWKGHASYIRRSHGPGWALVGEAGYFSAPITAHGFTDALRDAELLARAVDDGFGDELSLDGALEHYQTTRDRIGVPLFDVVDRLASHQWDDAEVAQLLRQLSSAMADEVETLERLEPN